MADTRNVLMGIFSGMAGDPSFPLRIQQQKMNMMMQLDKLKQEQEDAQMKSETAKAHLNWLKATTEKMETETKWGQAPVDYETGGGFALEGGEAPKGAPEEGITGGAPSGPRISWTQPQKKSIPMGMFEKLAPKLQQQIGAKAFGLPPEVEKGGDYEVFADPQGNQQYLRKGSTIPPGWTKYEKEGAEKVPNELRQFEMETGTDPSTRGTPKYQKAINDWRRNKKEVIRFESPFEQGKFAANLRKEFEDLKPVKDFRDTISKFSVMKEAFKESQTTKNFVATDQALITLFNKMTDPQSVVRESEYARTPSDLALVNRLRGKIDRLKAGGPGLTNEDRQALLTMGSKFMKVYEGIYRDEVRRYRGYADMAGIDPNAVAPIPKGTEDVTKTEEVKQKVSEPENIKSKNPQIKNIKVLP